MAVKKKSSGGDVRDSAHKIWLAGLGALSTVEEEGEKLFKTLVNKGEKYESPIKKPVGSVRKGVKKARARAGKTFESFEGALDERVSSVLNRLGVPSRDEIAELTRRVERLARAVEKKGTRKTATSGKKKTAGKKKTSGKKKTASRATKRAG
jgi:poly(hydroxyalkanoate) granule-associated protein